ncbi:MAG: hypothetical protein RL660_1574, partial [Bacteroidota bacterium]
MPRTAAKVSEKVAKVVSKQKETIGKAAKVAKELTKNLPLVQETIDRTYDAYDTNADYATKMLAEMAMVSDKTTEQLKNTMNTANDMFKTWFENQMTMTKTWFNTEDKSKTDANGATDWTAQYQTWMNQMQDMAKNNPMANMMNMDWMKNNPMANMMNMDWMKNNPMASMMNMDWMKNNPMASMMNM